MSPDELIDCYVADVARRMPGAKRNDVAFELRALLHDDLRGRAADAGRLPDEAMALDLLRGFGHPEEVADRYRPPGVTFIRPSESRMFAIIALAGVAIQWAVTLPLVFVGDNADGAALSRLGRWWTTFGLGAFWWPGFMVTLTMVAAWVGHAPGSARVWKPRAIDRNTINRAPWILGIAAAAVGYAFLLSIPFVLDNAVDPRIADVFRIDGEFVAIRAPWLLVFIAAHIVLFVAIVVEGRWRPLTRWLDIGISLVIAGLMVWVVAAGPILESTPGDQSVKGAMVLIVLIVLADVGFKIWRMQARIRPPAALKRQ